MSGSEEAERETPLSYEGVDELRHRTLQLFVRVLLWMVTPILLGLHTAEWCSGRYDAMLAVQGVSHVAACLLVIFLRGRDARALVAIAVLLLNGALIFLHYGPSFTPGLIYFAAALFGHVFFGWRAVVVILVLVSATFLGAGAAYSYGWTRFFDPAVTDLESISTWLRAMAAGVPVLAALTALVGQFQSGLQRSVSAAEAALARERAERAEKERLAEARQKAERALAEAQRQELIGRLAASASHDLNNVLTAIMGSAELAALDLEDQDTNAVRAGLDQIGESARRASAMGRQLLSFSRQQHTQPRNIDPDELFSGLRQLLVRLLPSNIKLTVSCKEDLPTLFVDPAQIEQVVMNLVINARDAMPEGGQVCVAVVDDPNDEGHPGIRIDVSDTGVGIPEEVRDKMFDPFFTTKEGGRGTGLGLATVQIIVGEYGGTVSYESTAGQGTTFRIWLPASDEARESVPNGPVSARPDTRGSERILVADDDAEIRYIAARMLSGAGYRVETAQDGHEVIERISASTYDLVVLDAGRPGPTGLRLVEHIETQQPGLKLLFSTGYDPGVFGVGFFTDGRRRLLSKPYRRADLLGAVRGVLDEQSA